jgi:hypothetical protein
MKFAPMAYRHAGDFNFMETVTMARQKVATAADKLDAMVESGILGWEFENGKHLSFNLVNLYEKFAEMPKVAQFGLARGIFETVRDTYAGSGGNADVAYDRAEGRLEILNSGEWVSGAGGGGPKLSDLFEAVRRAKVKAGQEVPTDDQLKAKFTGDNGKVNREAARANPLIAAELALIAEEKARAKREEAEKAGQANTSASAGLAAI